MTVQYSDARVDQRKRERERERERERCCMKFGFQKNIPFWCRLGLTHAILQYLGHPFWG
jgi:hypothetical protein